MPSSKITKALLLLVIVALIASAVWSWQPNNQETPSTQNAEQKNVADEKSADDATLNLHRWGAVTLFHGLPSDRVNAITEDANGALWFGTDNGLVRYDGRRTQVIGNETDSRGVLPSQRVRALLRDASGGLWIGTEQGVVRYVQDKISPLPETLGLSVTGLAESAAHEIAAVTSQGKIILFRNERADVKIDKAAYAEKLQAEIIDEKSQPLLGIEKEVVGLNAIAIAPDATQQSRWVIGSARRGALVLKNDSQTKELVEARQSPPRPYFVEAIFSGNGAGNKIWLGAQAGRGSDGLWFLAAESVSGLQQFSLPTGTVSAIHGGKSVDGQNELWVATASNGAFLLRNEQPSEHLTFESTKGGLRSNKIFSVYRDHEGIVWFGTDRGVCRYDRDSFRATNISTDPQSNFIRSLLVTKDGTTYAGTNRGLFILPVGLELGGWQQVSAFGIRAVHALLQATNGDVFAATSSGLFVQRNGESIFNPLLEEGQTKPQNYRALTMLEGKIYAIAFGQGIARVDTDAVRIVSSDPLIQNAICMSASPTEKIIRIGTPKLERMIFDGSSVKQELTTYREGAEGVGAKSAQALAHTPNKQWIGSEDGLYVASNNRPRKLLPGVIVQSLSLITEGADKHQILYCATRNAGLYKIQVESEAFVHLDTEQGLPSQQVFAVAQGMQGEIWIGTNKGIVRHQPNPTPPILEPRRLVADLIYTPDFLTHELRFPAYQKNYLLDVVGLGSKTFPSQFQYEYTVQEEKRGDLKHYLTSESQLELKDLAAGTYTITARAISRDLVYSAPYQIRLWISPEPVSFTTVLLTMLLLVAIGAGAYAFYQQRRTAKANDTLEIMNEELRTTRIQLANNTEAERSRIARDLHDQTLADLRNLLVMTDQLERPAKSATAPTSAELRSKIEDVSNEIRHICEDLSPSVLENIGFLPSLEWALSNAVHLLPAEAKIQYEFHCTSDLEDKLTLTPTEQIQLYRIVQEAITNVVKHAQASKIGLNVQVEAEKDLVISVQDDGKGFPVELENPLGQGVGNIRSRANLIGAEVKWANNEQGCLFIVRKAEVVQ